MKIYTLRQLTEKIYIDDGYDIKEPHMIKFITRIVQMGTAERLVHEKYDGRLEVIISKKYNLK